MLPTIRPVLIVSFLGAALAGALAAPGCSSSGGSAATCESNPWQCAAGTTCWPSCGCPKGTPSCTKDNCTIQFACVPDRAGTPAGASCSLTIGTAACGDYQTCVSFAEGGAGGGECHAYCDSTHGCPQDETCQELTVSNGASSVVEHACVAPPAEIDASLMIDGGAGSSSGGMSGDGAVVDAGFYDGTGYQM